METISSNRLLFQTTGDLMPQELVELLGSTLMQRHFATVEQPLPQPPCTQITWIVAANGIFKYGCTPTHRVLIQVDDRSIQIPDLVPLQPFVSWSQWPMRIPGSFLAEVLVHAQLVCYESRSLLEQLYYVVAEHGYGVGLIRPPQTASEHRVEALEAPTEPYLLDIHSHHMLPAVFSGTDDQDDAQRLGVSVVVGTIFADAPTLSVRLLVYGHAQLIPATLVFDSSGPFHDLYAESCL